VRPRLAPVRRARGPLAAGDPGAGPLGGPVAVVGSHDRPARAGPLFQPGAVLVLLRQPAAAAPAVDAAGAPRAAGVAPPGLERATVAGPVHGAVAGRPVLRAELRAGQTPSLPDPRPSAVCLLGGPGAATLRRPRRAMLGEPARPLGGPRFAGHGAGCHR